jgi:hypothetical protein
MARRPIETGSEHGHSARIREVDGVIPARRPHRPRHRASRPVAGCAPRLARHPSLWMHFRLSRCARPTPHASGSPTHRIRNKSRGSVRCDPRLCLETGFFSHFQGRIVLAPWSDQDSVAERIAPLLLMLTCGVYGNRRYFQVTFRNSTTRSLVPRSRRTNERADPRRPSHDAPCGSIPDP